MALEYLLWKLIPLLIWALLHRHWWRCAFHPQLCRFYPRTWLGVWAVLLTQLGALASPAMLAWLLLSLSWARRAPQVAYLEDPDFFTAQAKIHGPIFRCRLLLQDTLCVTDWQLARELLSQPGLVSPPLRFDRYLEGGSLRFAQGHSHATCRKSMQRLLQPASIERCRPFFENSVERGIQHLLEGAPLRPTLERLVEQALLGALFGVAPSHPDYAQLVQLYGRIDVAAIQRELWPLSAQNMRRALQELGDYLQPQAPLLLDIEPQALSEPMLRDNLLLLPHTAGQDVSGLLHWIVYHLASSPMHGPEVQPESFVWETLRREQSEYLYRKASQSLEWRGESIAPGDLLRICVREANRSLGPDTFCPPSQATPCTAFGFGLHRCPGQLLTLTLGALVVMRLRERCRLRITRNAPAEFDGWHWRPGSRIQIEFTVR